MLPSALFVSVPGETRRNTQRSPCANTAEASGCEHETAKGVFLNSVICGT